MRQLAISSDRLFEGFIGNLFQGLVDRVNTVADRDEARVDIHEAVVVGPEALVQGACSFQSPSIAASDGARN